MLSITIDKSKAKKKQTIKGSADDDSIRGSKFADKIFTNGGNDIVLAGKGNDTITTSASQSVTIGITKGDGNDTINLAEDNTVRFMFGGAPDFSFSKSGDNLVITATHDKIGKEKSPVKENVTIKNYFYGNQTDGVMISYEMPGMTRYNNVRVMTTTETDLLSGAVYLMTNRDLQEMLSSTTITQKGKAKKDNTLIGSSFNDTIYGGNKNDMIIDIAGTNTIYTGKKGQTFIETGVGNDKFVVSSINNKTAIYNDLDMVPMLGTGDEGNDTLQINGVNTDNLYMYFDMYSNGEVMVTGNSGTFMPSQALYFVTDKQLTSNLNNNAMENPVSVVPKNKKKPLSATNYKININTQGVTLGNYFSTDTIGKGKIENITIADSKGNNVNDISQYTIDGAIGSIKSKVSAYLIQIGGPDTQDLLRWCKETLNTKITKKMSKAEKTALKESQKFAKTYLANLANVYKSVKLGTDGNDVYTNISRQTIKFPDGTESVLSQEIYSGKGSDTFKFANDFQTVDIYADTESFGLAPANTDKLIFSNASFEDGTLYMNFNRDTNYAGIYRYNKDGYWTGTVNYTGFFRGDDQPIQAKNMIIQDAKRSYNVSYVNGTLADLSSSSSNNIIYSDGMMNVNTSKGYNLLNNDSTAGFNYITYGGGHDSYYMSGQTNDNYYVRMDNNSSVVIGDSGNYSGGNDILNLSADLNAMRVFFDVSANYGSPTGSLLFTTADNMTKDNLSNDIAPKGVLIYDQFTSWGNIETINFTDSIHQDWGVMPQTMLNGWISEISSSVAGWLNYHGDFNSVADVLANGTQSEVKEVLALYKSFNEYGG